CSNKGDPCKQQPAEHGSALRTAAGVGPAPGTAAGIGAARSAACRGPRRTRRERQRCAACRGVRGPGGRPRRRADRRGPQRRGARATVAGPRGRAATGGRLRRHPTPARRPGADRRPAGQPRLNFPRRDPTTIPTPRTTLLAVARALAMAGYAFAQDAPKAPDHDAQRKELEAARAQLEAAAERYRALAHKLGDENAKVIRLKNAFDRKPVVGVLLAPEAACGVGRVGVTPGSAAAQAG